MDPLTQSGFLAGLMIAGCTVYTLAISRDRHSFHWLSLLQFLFACSFLTEVGDRLYPGDGLNQLHIIFTFSLGPTAIQLLRIGETKNKSAGSISSLFARINLTTFIAILLILLFQQTASDFDLYFRILNCTSILLFLSFRIVREIQNEPGYFSAWIPQKRDRILFLSIGISVVLLFSLDFTVGNEPTISILSQLVTAVYIILLTWKSSNVSSIPWSQTFIRALLSSLIASIFTIFYALMLRWAQQQKSTYFINSFLVTFSFLFFMGPLLRLFLRASEALRPLAQRRLKLQMDWSLQRIERSNQVPHALDVAFSFLIDQFHPHRIRCVWAQHKEESIAFTPLRTFDLKSANWPLVSTELLQTMTQSAHDGVTILIGQNPQPDYDSTLERSPFRIIVWRQKNMNRAWIEIGFLDEGQEPAPWTLLEFATPWFEAFFSTMDRKLEEDRAYQKRSTLMLGGLASGLAHEIRNPLASIRGAAQLIPTSINETQLSLSTIIVQECDRLNRLVDSFLSVTKTAEKKAELFAISELWLRFQTLAFASIQTTTELKISSFSGRSAIFGDSDLLLQVLLNLLSNAKDAIPKSGPTLGCITCHIFETEDTTQQTREICIEIQDNGIGIPDKIIDQIWAPFFSTKAHGSGLGLAICKRIIQQHSGRIEVHSPPDGGTTVTVWIPIQNNHLKS